MRRLRPRATPALLRQRDQDPLLWRLRTPAQRPSRRRRRGASPRPLRPALAVVPQAAGASAPHTCSHTNPPPPSGLLRAGAARLHCASTAPARRPAPPPRAFPGERECRGVVSNDLAELLKWGVGGRRARPPPPIQAPAAIAGKSGGGWGGDPANGWKSTDIPDRLDELYIAPVDRSKNHCMGPEHLGIGNSIRGNVICKTEFPYRWGFQEASNVEVEVRLA